MSKNRRSRHRRTNQGLRGAIMAGVLIAVVLVGLQIWGNQTTAYYEGIPFDGRTLGDPDAPVTVIEYFDFQCPACQTASSGIVKPLVENYVESGDVKFTYKFFPVLDDPRGPKESTAAAHAAFCAAEQDAFWPYQNALFARRGQGNRGTYSDRNLRKIAGQVGLDEEAFNACLDSTAPIVGVEKDRQEGEAIGVRGTPSFLVNDVPVNGTYRDIENAIEEALASARAE